jgi:hypothetical protein
MPSRSNPSSAASALSKTLLIRPSFAVAPPPDRFRRRRGAASAVLRLS